MVSSRLVQVIPAGAFFKLAGMMDHDRGPRPDPMHVSECGLILFSFIQLADSKLFQSIPHDNLGPTGGNTCRQSRSALLVIQDEQSNVRPIQRKGLRPVEAQLNKLFVPVARRSIYLYIESFKDSNRLPCHERLAGRQGVRYLRTKYRLSGLGRSLDHRPAVTGYETRDYPISSRWRRIGVLLKCSRFYRVRVHGFNCPAFPAI